MNGGEQVDKAITEEINAVVRALSTLRLPAAPDEYDIHAMVGTAFKSAGISVLHEACLGAGCRIDFLCGHVGVEIKKNRPSRATLLKQVTRYADSPDVHALIMVAPGDLRLPASINGVPVKCVALARLWGVALP